MVKDLFSDRRPLQQTERKIEIFGIEPVELTTTKEPNAAMVKAFGEIDDMTTAAEGALVSIEKYADLLVVPIDDDDNEVRAAHLRQGGDGKFITFAQFQTAIDNTKRARADYAFNTDLKGYGFGDKRKVEKNRMLRNLNEYAGIDKDSLGSNWFEEVASVGLGALLLYGLNELIGLNQAPDNSAMISPKFPEGTEAPTIASQILRSVVMMMFLHGMTQEAVESYSKLGDYDFEGIDIKSTLDQAFKSGPPKSRSFDLMRAGLADSDNELISRHSIDYAARHVGDGFETWYAYLTTREVHERGLRESHGSKIYRQGYLKGNTTRASGLTQLANAGFGSLAKMQSVLGSRIGAQDACCLTRFMLAIDLNFLEAIRTIIAMAIALLEALAAAAFKSAMNLMMAPWSVIRSEIIRLIDGVLEKIVSKIIDAFETESEVWEIIKACTPVTELIQSVLDQIDWIQTWYKEMLDLFGEETEAWFKTQFSGWETVWGIKKAKEQLRLLDRIIAEKQTMVDAELPENQIFGLIEEVKGLSKTYDIEVDTTSQITRDMKILVSGPLGISERDELIRGIDARLAAAGVPDTDRKYINEELYIIAQDKNDSRLNQLMGYVEEGIGRDTLAGSALGGVNDLTREALDWCRTLADWDKMKGLFGAETNEPTKEAGI